MQKCNELREDVRKRFDLDPEEENSSVKDNKPSKLIIAGAIIYIIIAIGIIYFHPTKEVMHCNSNLICKIERTYFGILKINKKITLSPNSDLSCKIAAYSKGRNDTYYGLYLKFDGKYPFVFYVDNAFFGTYKEQHKELMGYCEKHYKKFLNYINSQEQRSYKIESRADKGSLFFALAMLIMIPVFGFIKFAAK